MKETYLNLLGRVWRIIFSPYSEWKKIKEEQKPWEKAEKEYLLPLWSLFLTAVVVRMIYLAIFAEYEYSKSSLSSDCLEVVASFLATIVCYYLAVIIRSKAYNWYEKLGGLYFLPLHINRNQDFTSEYIMYCSSLMVVTKILVFLVPVCEILYWPANLYAAYIFWHCYWQYCRNEQSSYNPQPLHFIVTTAALVYGLPFGIEGGVRKIIEFSLM